MITSILNRILISKLIFTAAVLLLCCVPHTRLCAEECAGIKGSNMDNPFGVLEFLHWNHSWNNYKYSSKKDLIKSVALMKEAGVGWVRVDFLWAEIEPEKGKFDFTKYDEIVDLVTQSGIQILGILDYSAPWAAACGDWNCPPGDNAMFVNYAIRTIAHFKSRVKHWELWNEPDSLTYWKTQDGMKSYCELLKAVYIAAKKEDPDCKILNGGLASGLASVNKLYDNGAGGYFDILNLHIFESPLHKDAVKAVSAYPKLAYKIMQRNGDGNKKIWVTEIGCPGVRRKKVPHWWMGENPDEREQAGWVKKVYGELLKDKNVEKVFWAFFRDSDGHWDNGIDYFGLVRWDFSKKPAFKTYKASSDAWKRMKR